MRHSKQFYHDHRIGGLIGSIITCIVSFVMFIFVFTRNWGFIIPSMILGIFGVFGIIGFIDEFKDK